MKGKKDIFINTYIIISLEKNHEKENFLQRFIMENVDNLSFLHAEVTRSLYLTVFWVLFSAKSQ